MGCFSYICKVCGKPVTSSSFDGDPVRLAFLVNGDIKEEMIGKYDSYGRVFFNPDELDIDNVKVCSMNSSIEWQYDSWGEMIDMHFNTNIRTGFAAIHVACDPEFKYQLLTRSKDDENQGWSYPNKTIRKAKYKNHYKLNK